MTVQRKALMCSDQEYPTRRENSRDLFRRNPGALQMFKYCFCDKAVKLIGPRGWHLVNIANDIDIRSSENVNPDIILVRDSRKARMTVSRATRYRLQRAHL